MKDTTKQLIAACKEGVGTYPRQSNQRNWLAAWLRWFCKWVLSGYQYKDEKIVC